MSKLSYSYLSGLTKEAQFSNRKRMNHNLHTELSDPVQRFAVAMEPGSYVRPHRHAQTWELLTTLRGRFIILIFDNSGTVLERSILGEDISVVEISMARWHTVLSLDTGGVLFEVKHGPYTPLREVDFGFWSPAVGDERSHALMNWYREAKIGECWRGI